VTRLARSSQAGHSPAQTRSQAAPVVPCGPPPAFFQQFSIKKASLGGLSPSVQIEDRRFLAAAIAHDTRPVDEHGARPFLRLLARPGVEEVRIGTRAWRCRADRLTGSRSTGYPATPVTSTPSNTYGEERGPSAVHRVRGPIGELAATTQVVPIAGHFHFATRVERPFSPQ
jgi:hypothetical protein